MKGPRTPPSPEQVVYDYLAFRHDDLAPADLIVGFGHFDPRIPRTCGRLWREGLAPRILFTGGIGAGTADLGQPEALYFRDELRKTYPEIPDGAVLLEPDSRHTGENIALSAALLRRVSPEASFEQGLARVILVATPARQRRVWLACRQHWPHLCLSCAPPPSTLVEDRALFASKGRDLVDLLAEEMARLLTYPGLGYIVEPQIPPAVLDAYQRLQVRDGLCD
ncbi:MAG: YdcF family protein [Anaerolineae bacterium]|nr:YdcF family protein [Anaerolineae bacterium]